VEDRLEPTNTLLCGPWGSAGIGSVGGGLNKGGERRPTGRRELSVNSEGRVSTEVGDPFSAGRAISAPLHLTSALSPFCPSFRVVSEPVSVSRLGDGDGRLMRCIILLMKLVTDEGREPVSDVVCRWGRVGKGSVLVTPE
jgi:hypothetical protein